MNAITVENISKKFIIPHRKKTSIVEWITQLFAKKEVDTLHVLQDVSFSIEKGKTVGIIGTNGSGKSTLLKLLAGIYLPDEGTIEKNGKVVPFLELGVGFNPELTGRENIFLNGAILGMPRAYLTEKFDNIVAFAELERFIDLPIKNYSSGMQVRLAFSIAFMIEADIYLLDEVFSVGDQKFQAKSKKIFEDLKSNGKTLLLVSHSLDTIQNYCDQILFVNNGRVTFYSNVKDGIDAYIASLS
ncbi:MAG: ABC transporter ATP-binding protein [Candidatus Dojkabacteria bacterium]|nr:MAG: ABC transporter ATP-binding protein [Candidatus Dojkabacteria bacterium]